LLSQKDLRLSDGRSSQDARFYQAEIHSGIFDEHIDHPSLNECGDSAYYVP